MWNLLVVFEEWLGQMFKNTTLGGLMLQITYDRCIRAAVTSYQKLELLETIEMYSVTLLEARCLEIKVWEHGRAFPEGRREGVFLASSSF